MNISEEMNQQQDQKQVMKQKTHPMIKLLNEYHQKLKSQQNMYKQILVVKKSQVSKRFNQQLDIKFSLFQKQFNKNKHQFSTQLKTIQYYKQNFIQKHALNPKQNNLYPLFNQIEKKIQQNNKFLQQKFTFQFKYPQHKDDLEKKLQKIKSDILSKQLIAIRLYLGQNQNIVKYCNKQLKKLNQIHQQYNGLMKMAEKRIYTPEIQFTGNFQQCLLVLQMNQKIQKLTLGIRSQTGKLNLQQYKQLFNNLLSSRNILTNLTLKIMDMQFEQLKCNEIKLFIKQLKQLKKLKIQNYFRQNKLGMFEDFNWLPLKKQTHVVGKVW